MAANPLIAHLGFRTEDEGTSGALAIAVGTALDGGNRTGLYASLSGTEHLGALAGGFEAARFFNDSVDKTFETFGPAVFGAHLQVTDKDAGHTEVDGDIWYDTGTNEFQFRENGTTKTLATGSASPGGADTNVQFNNAGAFGGSSEFTWDDTGKVLTVTGNAVVAQGTITSSEIGISHTVEWNDAVTPFTAIQSNVTDTASGSASLLLDLQVTGSTAFSVRKDGFIFGSLLDLFIGGDFTGSEDALTIRGTWNTGSDVDAILVDLTNSAAGSGSNLIDLREDGFSQFRVRASSVSFDPAVLSRIPIEVDLETITDPVTGFTHLAIWNDGADTFTAIEVDITDTASAVASLLLDLQVGSTTQFSVRKDGLATANQLLADQGTIADPAVGIENRVTWNDGADTFKAVEIDITDTASAAGSLAIDVLVDAASVFSVDKAGNVDMDGKLTVGGLIDPTGLELTPQGANPGGVPANTLWLNSGDSDRLYHGSTALKLSTVLGEASSNSTLSRHEHQYIGLNTVTASGAFQIDLPASPVEGDEVEWKDQEGDAEATNVTIDGNGNNIDGSLTFTVNEDFQGGRLIFAFSEWRVM